MASESGSGGTGSHTKLVLCDSGGDHRFWASVPEVELSVVAAASRRICAGCVVCDGVLLVRGADWLGSKTADQPVWGPGGICEGGTVLHGADLRRLYDWIDLGRN